jgi:SOS-response transcriptional repressor LexA
MAKHEGGLTKPRQPSLPELTPIERSIYEMCVAAACENRPLDSTETMAEAIGANSYSTVPGILKRLEKKGWITRSIFQKGRQVCITATGRCTIPPRDQTPHWRLIYAKSKDSTPTLPRHTVADTIPGLMAYIDKMMREENLTFQTAQIALMSMGVQLRETEARNAD